MRSLNTTDASINRDLLQVSGLPAPATAEGCLDGSAINPQQQSNPFKIVQLKSASICVCGKEYKQAKNLYRHAKKRGCQI